MGKMREPISRQNLPGNSQVIVGTEVNTFVPDFQFPKTTITAPLGKLWFKKIVIKHNFKTTATLMIFA